MHHRVAVWRRSRPPLRHRLHLRAAAQTSAGRSRRGAAACSGPEVRPRSLGFRSQRPSAGRSVPLRRRHLARQYADPRGPFELRLLHHPRRPGAGRGEGSSSSPPPSRPIAPLGSDAQKVGDFYLLVHGHRARRKPGPGAAAGRTRSHRRDHDAARRRALHRLLRSASASRSRSPGSRRPTTRTRPCTSPRCTSAGSRCPTATTTCRPTRSTRSSARSSPQYVERHARARRRAQCEVRRRAHRGARDAASRTTSGPRCRTAIR